MMEPEQIQRFQRELRAAARSADDAEGLAQLVELQRQLESAVAERARALHADGYSWTELARPLGVSRQAARQRYGRPVDAAGSFHAAVDGLAAGAAGVDLAELCEGAE